MNLKETFVIGIGELLWDIFPEGKRLGGAPANFAYHASKLGAKGITISAVGDDELGKEILEELAKVSLDTRQIQIVNCYPTGTVKVELDEAGKPEYKIAENVAWDYIDYQPGMNDVAQRAGAVCFGTLGQRAPRSRASIREFIYSCPDQCIKMLDVNLRQSYYSKPLINESFSMATHLKLNDEELEILPDLLGSRFKGDDFIKQLMDKYEIYLTLVTYGSKGSQVLFDGKSEISPAQNVDVVSTVGAGDAFTASFVVSLLKGEMPKEANLKANKLAAFVCGEPGAMPKY